MNKRGNENRSVRGTKRRLRTVLLSLMEERPVNEITVKELTELADINRGTFYFHYSDVYDLLRSVEDDFFAQFEAAVNAIVLTGEEGALPYLTAVFAFMGENSDLCKVTLGPNGDMQFMERVERFVEEKCAVFWRELAPGASRDRMELYNAFVVKGLVGIVKKWLDDGLAESPQEIARFVIAIISQTAQTWILP